MGIVLRALLFDVQGTATDFHSTVCAEARRIGGSRYRHIDWPGFVDHWRAEYFAALRRAVPDRDNWVTVHSVYANALDGLLGDYGIDLSPDQRADLTLAWQRLEPWPDVVAGLIRLASKFTIATLSNADVAAVVNISKRAALPWDAVFTAEMAGAFKPDPTVYRMAARYLGLEPSEIMMVASHKYDIQAAGALGFRTAFVARPLEFGAGGDVDISFDEDFDVNATDFLDLADQLGC
ncbi:haloacid dehalogenase type II [Nocardia vinacea]|uniref:haloacid dehalogenase type II n=1 Tax=Nocardia vinacea TaxID=96468 RepID=UPI0005925624|nr:haloacid dehalogenase type II [Nocardia vinacea]